MEAYMLWWNDGFLKSFWERYDLKGIKGNKL
jgi:hypothetical protein